MSHRRRATCQLLRHWGHFDGFMKRRTDCCHSFAPEKKNWSQIILTQKRVTSVLQFCRITNLSVTFLMIDKIRSLWLLCAAASNISRLYMKTVIYFDRHLPEWHTIVHEPGVWAVLWNGNDHCVIKHLTRKKESTFTCVERYKEVSWLLSRCCFELLVLGDSEEFLLFNSRC